MVESKRPLSPASSSNSTSAHRRASAGSGVTQTASFDGLDAILVNFANGFSFLDGEVFDLVAAGTLSGITEAMFSVHNLNANFGYAVAVDATSVRLTVLAKDRHAVPELATLALLPLACAAATLAARRRRH